MAILIPLMAATARARQPAGAVAQAINVFDTDQALVDMDNAILAQMPQRPAHMDIRQPEILAELPLRERQMVPGLIYDSMPAQPLVEVERTTQILSRASSIFIAAARSTRNRASARIATIRNAAGGCRKRLRKTGAVIA